MAYRLARQLVQVSWLPPQLARGQSSLPVSCWRVFSVWGALILLRAPDSWILLLIGRMELTSFQVLASPPYCSFRR